MSPDIDDEIGAGAFDPSKTHPMTPTQTTDPPTPTALRPFAEVYKGSLDRFERRALREEKTVPLPLGELGGLFGGTGFWPGLYVLVGATGSGKTQLCVQLCRDAVRDGVPTVYVGLELGADDWVARLVGNETETRWSTLFQGTQPPDQVGPALLAAGAAAATLAELPLYLVEGAPQGFSYADLRGVAEATRKLHPAGPALLVVDYLQLIGAVDGEDTRARVGAAAYQCRAIARDLGMAVLVVSSVARANYKRLRLPRVGGDGDPKKAAGAPKGEDKTDTAAEAELFVERADMRESGRMRNPDALIGLGKESGEIEYAADGLLVMVRLASRNSTEWVALTVPKVRAGRPGWVPLVFESGKYSAGTYDDADTILRGKLPQPRPAPKATPAYGSF